MNAINGFADVLLNEPLSKTQLDYVQRIKVASRTLLACINDILDLSKIEAGMLEISKIDFEFLHVLEDQLVLFGQQLNQKSVEIAINYDMAIPKLVRGDDIRIAQVFTNLVGNAVKFTSAGEIEIGAKLIKTTGSENCVECFVRDTGIGMEKSYLNRIFEPFTQADGSTTRKFGGTGLGMFITKQLVEKMGGEIHVESTVDVGTCFTFTVPLSQPESVHFEYKYDFSSIQEQGVAGVALAYKNSSVLKSLSAQFASFKIDVAACSDVDSLKSHLSSKAPELVVIDSESLPSLTPEAIADMRQLCTKDQTYFILVTQLQFEDANAVKKQLGVDAIFQKPLRPTDVSRLVSWHQSEESLDGPPRTKKSIESSLQGLKILVVDDSEVNRLLARVILEKMGAELAFAEDGKQAVSIAKETVFDVILLDLQMPVMGGIDAAIKIRQSDGACTDVPIIALTAKAMVEDKQECFEAGMNAFLSKPFEATSLKQTIIDILPGRLSKKEQAAADDTQVHSDSESGATPLGIKTTISAFDQYPTVEFDKGVALWQDNEALYRKMLAQFLSRKQELLLPITEHIEQHQYTEAYELVHNIHGQSGNLSVSRIYVISNMMERILTAPEPPNESTHANLGELARQLTEAFADLNALLAKNALSSKSDEPNQGAPALSTGEKIDLYRGFAEQLRNADMDALDTFDAIKSSCSNVLHVKKDMEVLETQLNNFVFKDALATFLRVAQALQVDLGDRDD